MATMEIHSVQSVSGNQPRMRRIIEEAGQTFLSGVPVAIAAGDGGVAEKAATDTVLFAGFSKEAANNLGALGTNPQASVTPPQSLTFGSVPFESAARNIGRPLFNDGRIGFETADVDTVFLGQVGPAQTTAATDIGKSYGLTKDSDGHWYVDKTKTTAGSVYVTVVRLDPNDQSASPRGVYFVCIPSMVQVAA